MRQLLIGVAAVLGVVIAAAIVIPIAVPVWVYEGRVAALVKQATGRDLRVAGPVKLSIAPALGFAANDVSFANMPGGHAPDMVAVKQVRLRLQLWSLLHGAVVVSRVDLVRPVIALEVDKTGRPNWLFGLAASTAPASGAAGPAQTGSGLNNSSFTLRKVRIVDGNISYLDQRTGKTERLDGIDMTLLLHSLGGAFAGDGSAAWNRERVTFAVNIASPRALLVGAESLVAVKLAAAPVTLDFSGRVAGSPSLRLGGAIDIESSSLRRLAQWAGSPISLSGNSLGLLGVKGTVAITGTLTSFTDADISLDAIRAKGSISIDSAGVRPTLTGKLDVDRIDINPYLMPATASATPPAAAGGLAPTPSAAVPNGRTGGAIDLSTLKLANIDFRLTVGGIVYHQFQIGPSAGNFRVKDGRLTAELSRMELYRGNGRGKVTVDGSGAVPSVGLDAALAQVQILPLAQATIGNGRLTGSGNLDIAVTARGGNWRDWINTLSGRGALHLANGRIEGVNLPALADSAARIGRDLISSLNVAGALNLLARGQINQVGPLALLSDAARSLTGGGNVSNFATLSATCAVANGMVRNNDLRVQLGAIPLTGTGIVDLRTRVVDYRVSLQLAGGVVVPIQVSGTVDNLSYKPDLTAMLTQTPGNVAAILNSAGGSLGKNLEGVGQTLKGVGQGAVGVLNGIFGR